jgi:DNA mismatch endonuclease (patch repair protein)
MTRKTRLTSPPATSLAVAAVMRANKKRDSGPELTVRRLLHSLGYRYRLYGRDLPGNPDIVFRSRRKAVFVHGCFWHQHQDPRCPFRTHPKSNMHYWKPKLLRNQERDRATERRLADMGWRSEVVWECQLRDLKRLREILATFLESQ